MLVLLPAECRDLPEADFQAIAALREHPRLRQLGSEVMGNMNAGSTADFWRDWDIEQTYLPVLHQRGLKFGLFKLTDGTYQLNFRKQPLSDLAILRGTPISELTIDSCDIMSLEPLKDLRVSNRSRSRVGNWSGKELSELRYLRHGRIEDC